jgi:YD repeat-containing protein
MKHLFRSALLLILGLFLPFFDGSTRAPFLQVSYIYGYHHSVVVAEVTHAGKDQIAFSSFETATDQGYWQYAGTTASPGRTGTQFYTLGSGSIQRLGLSKGKYTLSYWANTAASVTGTNYTLVNQFTGDPINGWTYYETTFTLSLDNSSITLSGTANLDELRLYPFDAVMTTATYDPLVGKTSETDANHVTTFYEYDAFHRLKRVKDQYGNIIKQLVYHYKGQ